MKEIGKIRIRSGKLMLDDIMLTNRDKVISDVPVEYHPVRLTFERNGDEERIIKD